jgi:DNA-binding YbaB/EbfC family protein
MDMLKMMKQAQEVQGKLQQIQEDLQNATVTGSAGGGAVKVIADGKGNVKDVQIDPSVVNPPDVAGLEDLVTLAVADAQKKATEHAEAEVKKLTGGMNLPFKLPF